MAYAYTGDHYIANIYVNSKHFYAFESTIKPAFRCLLGMWLFNISTLQVIM